MTHNSGDWLEWLHHFLYFFIRGKTYENQYAGTVHLNEEQLEKTVFHQHDISYNPLSYWKRLRKKDSQGSWRMTHDSHPHYVESGYQLHITLYRNSSNPDWTDIYAHYEKNWSADPLGHLQEKNFSAAEGVMRLRKFFRDETTTRLYDKS